MTRTQVMNCRSALLPIAITAAMMVLALSAAAQTSGGSSGKATAPPDWVEQWSGIYGAQDNAGKNAPPGFKVLVPRKETDEVAVAHSQPWALARREVTDLEVEDMGQLCKPTGLFRANSNGGFELLVSPGRITLIALGGGGISTGGIRRIYMDRPHLKNSPLLWYGDSVGHWEGDTLVVDAIGFNDQTWLSSDRTRHSEALHLIERWRFVANGTYLERISRVDDPLALTSPYTLSRYYKKLPADSPIRENLCEDTPESRRAWVKIHQRAVKELEETRAVALQPEAKKTEGQLLKVE